MGALEACFLLSLIVATRLFYLHRNESFARTNLLRSSAFTAL